MRILVGAVIGLMVMLAGGYATAQSASRYVVTPLASGLKTPWSLGFSPTAGS
jgi:hypothetical protein